MAQNVTVAGASYSAVPSVDLPKTGGGTSSFYDVSDTTATASDVASGKYFYTAAGVRTEGTSSGGGMAVFDEVVPLPGGGDHHIITGVDISSDTVTAAHLETGYTAHDAEGNAITGTLSPGGGGLEYEEGTWTPVEDVSRGEISFANPHTYPPSFTAMADMSPVATSVSGNNQYFHMFDAYRLFGGGFPRTSSTTAVYYGVVDYGHYSGAQRAYFSVTSDNVGAQNVAYPRYWADTQKLYPYTGSSSRYWRAGRTYKWIAVWAPTT